MTIKINDLKFDGPIQSTDKLKDDPGIYAILCEIKNKFYLLDVGESETVKTKIESHDRKDCWKKQFQGDVLYAVLYIPDKDQAERNSIEKHIRNQYKIPCG
jgi:hypothetical protein